jgi:hypothetical protein
MWKAANKLLVYLQRVSAADISREQVDALAGLAGAEAQREVRQRALLLLRARHGCLPYCPVQLPAPNGLQACSAGACPEQGRNPLMRPTLLLQAEQQFPVPPAVMMVGGGARNSAAARTGSAAGSSHAAVGQQAARPHAQQQGPSRQTAAGSSAAASSAAAGAAAAGLAASATAASSSSNSSSSSSGGGGGGGKGKPSGSDTVAQLQAALARPRACWRCGSAEAKLKKCLGCNVAFYCSHDCHAQHWKVHKGECKAWKEAQGQAK